MDYPNNRVILRCDASSAATCSTLPAVINDETRDSVRGYCPL